jgi:hypothetical protein
VLLGSEPFYHRYGLSPALLEYCGKKIDIRYNSRNRALPIMAFDPKDGRAIDLCIPCIEAQGFQSDGTWRAYLKEIRAAKKANKDEANALARAAGIVRGGHQRPVTQTSPAADAKVVTTNFANQPPDPPKDWGRNDKRFSPELFEKGRVIQEHRRRSA